MSASMVRFEIPRPGHSCDTCILRSPSYTRRSLLLSPVPSISRSPAIRAPTRSLNDHTMTDGLSDSASILSLSDIIDIPDDEPEPAQAHAVPEHAPHTPTRANAMSLGFILSDVPSSGSPNPTALPARPPVPVRKPDPNTKGELGGTRIRGWAPPDPHHYTPTDILLLQFPVLLLSAKPGYVLSAEYVDALTVSPAGDVFYQPSTQRGSPARTKGTRTPVSAGPGRSTFPASSPHLLAALSSPHRNLDLSATPRPVPAPAPRRPIPSTPPPSTPPPSAPRPAPPQRSAASASRRVPPAPRGGVAPALARRVTHIRAARERALQSHTARPRKGGDAPRSGDAPTPSVLGRWVLAET